MNLLEKVGLDDNQKKLLLYLNDPVAFTRDIIGLKCEYFHQEWLNAFENNKFNVLLAPRGHGKTLMVGSYIIWRIARDRKVRVLIVTINQDKANDMMTFIQSNLANNQKLIDIFGEFKGYHEWSRSQIRVKQIGDADIMGRDATLKVLGVSSAIVGSHFDLVVLDDITDDDNSRTEGRRRDLEKWYDSELVGTFMSHTKVINIGTRWHEDDIHNYLMNKPGYQTLRYQALINPVEVEQGKPAKVLWPEHLPWDEVMIRNMNDELEPQNRIPEDTITLKFIREHQGELAFWMQYQNTIIPSSIAKFKPEWIDTAINKWRKLGGSVPLGLKKYIGVDLGGEETNSDWGVSTVIGKDEIGDIYVLDQTRTHSPTNRQFEIMKALDDKWNVSKIGMESVAQQKHEVSDVQRKNPNLPIVPIKSSRANDRETRTDRLSVLFETGRVYLNPSLNHLVDELKMYPRGKHDDCIDSLSFAIEVSQEGKLIDWGRVADVMVARKTYKLKKI